ncbi:DUF885 domain-containing protein [Glycocaulis sp.]|uniref:DUF885 domain-containing protein n=1 Tax=Glycocaulis sp. TaxID=1969725 RepID=UPI003D1DB5B2
MTNTLRQRLSGAALSALLLAAPIMAAPALASVATQDAAAEQSESQRLNAWFEQVEQQSLDRSPLMKAYRGIIDEDYGLWGDFSNEFAEESFQIGEDNLSYMRENFDFDALDSSAQLSWRLFEYGQENARANNPFRRHGYVFHQMSGMHANIPVFLTTIHRINSLETAEAWVSRAGSVDEVMNTLIDEAEARFEMGIQPPRWMYDYIIETAQNVISGAPFDGEGDNVVWESYERNINQIDISAEDRVRLLNEGREALLGWVAPYERLIGVMTAQRESAAAGDGVWRLPDGEAFYNARLAHFTTTDLTAQEVHDLGVENVERIHREMEAIMEEVEFEGSLQDFFVFMREDPQFYYPNTDEGRQAYLDEATAIIERMNERLPEYFITLPQHELEVRRVEPFREASAGKAFYSRPAADGSRPGIYYANLRDMADMPIYQMEALAYHEGNPGHHMQLAIMTDLEDVPSFRRFGGYTAYTEGWGLYTEYLPLEMGFYEDPYSNFGRLAMELWRAARLVVDTGLHYKQWSREQAIEYLVENTPNPRGDATNAIERYIVMPGQATAYMIGMLEILALRERAETALGDDFDIRMFHEVVLRDGAVPLAILEELIDEWIAEVQAG